MSVENEGPINEGGSEGIRSPYEWWPRTRTPSEAVIPNLRESPTPRVGLNKDKLEDSYRQIDSPIHGSPIYGFSLALPTSAGDDRQINNSGWVWGSKASTSDDQYESTDRRSRTSRANSISGRGDRPLAQRRKSTSIPFMNGQSPNLESLPSIPSTPQTPAEKNSDFFKRLKEVINILHLSVE